MLQQDALVGLNHLRQIDRDAVEEFSALLLHPQRLDLRLTDRNLLSGRSAFNGRPRDRTAGRPCEKWDDRRFARREVSKRCEGGKPILNR